MLSLHGKFGTKLGLHSILGPFFFHNTTKANLERLLYAGACWALGHLLRLIPMTTGKTRVHMRNLRGEGPARGGRAGAGTSCACFRVRVWGAE